ncbi:MAG: DUF1405 domain-containing protein [Candidatus Altiarchaeota archaeon]|nr:DUF1405 domain-containing protein [Candidatus Altiarchaeota archaeon]
MGILLRYIAWTERLLENRFLLLLFIAINILGTAVGIITYGSTMSRTNPLLWILLVDCPIYPAFMVFLLAFRKNRFIQRFSFFAFYGLIKYGMWTISAWTLYADTFLSYRPLVNGLIFIGHFGMILEAGFVARRAAASSGLEVWLPVGWMLANDFSDYVLGTHPPLPDGNYLAFLLAQNIIFDAVLPVLALVLIRKELEKQH